MHGKLCRFIFNYLTEFWLHLEQESTVDFVRQLNRDSTPNKWSPSSVIYLKFWNQVKLKKKNTCVGFKALNESWLSVNLKGLGIQSPCSNLIYSLNLFSIRNRHFEREWVLHKHWFSTPNISTVRARKPFIFQTMNSVWSNSLSLKYQRFTT